MVEGVSSFPVINCNCEHIPEDGDNETLEVLLDDPFISRKVEDEDQDDIFYELLANDAHYQMDINYALVYILSKCTSEICAIPW